MSAKGEQLELPAVIAEALALRPHEWCHWWVSPKALDPLALGRRGRWVSACGNCGVRHDWYALRQTCLGVVGELMRHREPVPARWAGGFAERMRVGRRGWGQSQKISRRSEVVSLASEQKPTAPGRRDRPAPARMGASTHQPGAFARAPG